jgi:hypothetical protein
LRSLENAKKIHVADLLKDAGKKQLRHFFWPPRFDALPIEIEIAIEIENS